MTSAPDTFVLLHVQGIFSQRSSPALHHQSIYGPSVFLLNRPYFGGIQKHLEYQRMNQGLFSCSCDSLIRPSPTALVIWALLLISFSKPPSLVIHFFFCRVRWHISASHHQELVVVRRRLRSYFSLPGRSVCDWLWSVELLQTRWTVVINAPR